MNVPEDRVAKILARAAEIDRVQTVQLDAIRSAAIEAGISAEAIDRALEEYAIAPIEALAIPAPAPEPQPKRPLWRRLLGKLGRPLQLAALACLAGIVTGGLEAEPLLLFGFVLWLGYAIHLVWRARKPGDALGFGLLMAGVTFGGSLGLGVSNGDEDVMAVTLFTGLAIAIIGTLVILVANEYRALKGSSADAVPTA